MYAVLLVSAPEVTSARPSGRVVAVGYHRRYAMFGSGVHFCVLGSKMLAMAEPMKLESTHSCPPATRTRPSASTVWPEQKMSRTCCWVSLGTGMNTLVAGSHSVAEVAPMQSGPPSHKRIFPVVSRTMLIATIGKSIVDDHWPTTAGSVTALDTVTVRTAEGVRFPAASRARALSVCDPLAAPVVSQVTEYGAAVSSAPSNWPSRRNCTPATPTLSDADAETLTWAATVAPAAGAVSDTAGGVVSEVVLATVKDTTDEAPVLPAGSRATAVSW